MLKFAVTVERVTKKALNEQAKKEQLKFIASAAERNATAGFDTQIPGKLQTETESGEGDNRTIKYTAVIIITKERFRDETAVKRNFERVVKVMTRAANRTKWTLVGDEAMKWTANGYVVVNHAGEETGDPAPRLFSELPNVSVRSKNLETHVPDDFVLPELNDEVMLSHFGHIYDREPHIRLIYDNLKTAVKTGFKTRHHILLKGKPACISGDAIVELNRAGKSFKMPLAKLYERFNGITKQKNHVWNKNIKTAIRAMDDDGCIRLYEVAGVLDSGIKQTVEVVTSDGKVVRATLDHRFYTEGGWKELKDIKEGEKIAVDGGPAKANGRKWKRGRYLEKKGLKFHPFATRKATGRYTVRVHRLAIEAEQNGLSLEDYVARLRNGSVDGLMFMDRKLVVHHEDTNTYNNVPGNLEVKSRKDHSTEHSFADKIWTRFVASRKFVEVVKIHAPKDEHVYDVQLDTEPHNFLANGIVVHNCAKTVLFLSFIDWLGDDLIEPIDASTMTKAGLERLLMEKSNAGTLKPILILEEIEKCHPENLSCLIQVMDSRGKIQRVNANTVRDGETSADANIVVWATCNDEDELMKFHSGALHSRFGVQPECDRPDRTLMERILRDEIKAIDGNEVWIEPVLDFCFGELSHVKKFADKHNDPRFARSLLASGDRLLDDGPKGALADFRKACKIGKS